MVLIYKDVSLFEFQVTNYVMQSKSAVSKTDSTYFDESCFVFTEDRGNQGSLSVADFRALFVSLLKSCVSSRRECVYINQGLFLLPLLYQVTTGKIRLFIDTIIYETKKVNKTLK